MKISVLWLPVIFYLGFVTRCLITISVRRFCLALFNRSGHF